ncbi:MAG TPA: citrate/2-methylcitrate synthase [Chloroflexia bacterium]|nr:citrate/2-methylcitrate synthase [Chloroflexia bacterium]
MSDQKPAQAKGLEGVVVGTSALSNVEGDIGRLSYRGYNIDDLAEQASFEEVVYLLWHGELPTADELDAFSGRLRAARPLPDLALKVLRLLPTTGAPIDALRTVVSALALDDKTVDDTSREAIIAKGTRLAGMFPTILAAYDRIRKGREPVAPRDDLGHAANMLYMLNDEEPREELARALNTYLVLAAEHSLNASTFAAMVTISAVSDYYSAIVTALGTLRGVSHGRANEKAMDMLQEIGSPDKVEAFIDNALASKRKLMGMGHRIYKTRDPRAKHLARHAESLSQLVQDPRWFEIATKIDSMTATHPYFSERKIYPNVEFYSAPVLFGLGLAPDLMPAAFAVSRISGWTGHVLEQLADNRIIRPSAEYNGPALRPYSAQQRG